MDQKPLVGSEKIQTLIEPRLTQMSLINKYNVFIRNYNQPNCIVNSTTLQYMPSSFLHDSYFMALSEWKGRVNIVVSQLLVLILLFVPILDGLMSLASLYCLYIYCKCLSIHDQNIERVADPFKNMVYDHDLCFKLRKDYYSFSIQFKELQGFSLNYNKDMRKELTLREERGKVNFLIYNGNFWVSYHHFGKWRQFHLLVFFVSAILSVVINILFFKLLF